ncbi:uncharacterized protein DDB_G0287625-like [Octopus bimaculoides]|uniref:uncharacterized protein DDB_G0287625-like n=1 Tax=Octopus bimaculoides TaxID=37653 RepID=UPI00071C4847|nr:uncharacterized protein DDB_G0287625-like [Octopus bimaculoides]|eukprot:XP_014771448.1 PREDICTED: uncharacterized protein DDB_G0287625-like [Octopus bimaculoides]
MQDMQDMPLTTKKAIATAGMETASNTATIITTATLDGSTTIATTATLDGNITNNNSSAITNSSGIANSSSIATNTSLTNSFPNDHDARSVSHYSSSSRSNNSSSTCEYHSNNSSNNIINSNSASSITGGNDSIAVASIANSSSPGSNNTSNPVSINSKNTGASASSSDNNNSHNSNASTSSYNNDCSTGNTRRHENITDTTTTPIDANTNSSKPSLSDNTTGDISDITRLQKYEGCTGNSVKQRLCNHFSSFGVPERRYVTSLASHIWQLRDEGIPYSIAWKILENPGPYINRTGRCKLCIAKCARILKDSIMGERILNCRTEIFGP